MAANKKQATKKGKASARANAQNRAQAQQGLARTPRTAKNKETDFGRFPGETPLTGEDRPSTRAGSKRKGFRQDAVVGREKVQGGNSADLRAPSAKRRISREPA